MTHVAVSFEPAERSPGQSAAIRAAASQLADELALPLLTPQEQSHSQYPFILQTSENGLELVPINADHPGAVKVDFEHPTLAYRSTNQINRQAICRAVGVKPGRIPSVLDATAGLGKDAFLLATAGCSVYMLERNPVVHALLRDGMLRAVRSLDVKVSSTVGRMQLALTSLAHYAATRPEFDVVYLDPMFPERRKSAQVKKDMYLLQKFFEDSESDSSDADLLTDAMSIASHRVVIKRPRRAPDIDNRIPTFRLSGRSSRYDVYVTG